MAYKRRRSSHEERIQAIQLLAQGYSKPEVARILNVAESSVYAWQKKYRDGGLAEISTKIASGRAPLLSDEQMLNLSRMLRLNPRQLELDCGLWTRKYVRELVRREFGVDYTDQNIGRLLKMIGFSPRKPSHQALQRDEVKLSEWMDSEFPAIRKRAREEGAQIFFADEAACRSDYQSGTARVSAAEEPAVKYTEKREKIGIISAIGMRGEMYWRIFEGTMNSECFIEFLKDLIKDVKGKIFLVVNNFRYHKSVMTRKWVQEHQSRIELFYLALRPKPGHGSGKTLRMMVSRVYSPLVKVLRMLWCAGR